MLRKFFDFADMISTEACIAVIATIGICMLAWLVTEQIILVRKQAQR